MTFLLANWRLIFLAGFVAVCAAAVGVSRLELAHVRSKLADETKQVAEYQASIASLQAATMRQNDSISALEALAKSREDQAAEALKTAAIANRDKQTKAQIILSSRPALGVDQCAAASAAFDAELKQERGK